MIFLAAVVAHTPLWVWGLLAYLVWQGVLALRPRTVSIVRLLILPAVFMVLGVRALLMSPAGASALVAWGIALLVFGLLGFGTGPALLAVDPEARLVRRPGSVVPLVRNVAVFVLQYVFAVIAMGAPDQHAAAVIAARAVSGATSGYFLGWLIGLGARYRHAPRQSLVAG